MTRSPEEDEEDEEDEDISLATEGEGQRRVSDEACQNASFYPRSSRQ
jgi:hypothetical protein